ncbi:HAAS signaling domain-containing protein [Cellulomonas carbonis]|uniref:DUF1700 domain-containing protein n=1 Tax=Cellulomonas carbonis T26 TaxID=947969 RepID=A0A0A0BPR9_9CELL|nr:hypothetical protein [Cellulomonas carbonis]KGM09936.1 hypothetical protein N868_17625 [Cellulomonas carbonis T26]GGC10261.1 hypothetical protein GCM10010972_24460 [Cellulomonas carbonis]
MTSTGRADRIRLEWYLARLSWALQDYPGRRRREVIRQLRSDTLAAAAEVGMAEALRDLGHPVALAEGYVTELGRRLPRYTSGAVAAALAVGALVYLSLAYAAGTIDTLEALGGGSVTTHPLGGEVTFTALDGELSVASSLSWQGGLLHAAVGAVAFVLVGRLWRLLG